MLDRIVLAVGKAKKHLYYLRKLIWTVATSTEPIAEQDFELLHYVITVFSCPALYLFVWSFFFFFAPVALHV